MDKEHLLKLTSAVYRVTAVFPVGEEEKDLGSKIRELADKILVNLLSDKINENVSRQIRELLEYFGDAESKNWVDPRNFLVLRREYAAYSTESSFYENLTQLSCEDSGKIVPCLPAGRENSNGHRKEKILEVMNSNGMVKIGDIIKMFPDINRRTVLRDMDKLCQVGALVRNGNGRGAHYVKNGHNGSNISP